MTATADEPRVLALVEAAPVGSETFNADGTVNLVIARPRISPGPGSFTVAVLERDAGAFVGVPMFDGLDDPRRARERRGLPRPPSELAGELLEAWWDPELSGPRDRELGFARGGVRARAKVTERMAGLLRRIPSALKVCANVVVRDGRIVAEPDEHSVDFVTASGLGARTGGEVLESVVRERSDAVETALEGVLRELLAYELRAGERIDRQVSDAVSAARPGADRFDVEMAVEFAREVESRRSAARLETVGGRLREALLVPSADRRDAAVMELVEAEHKRIEGVELRLLPAALANLDAARESAHGAAVGA